MRSGHAWIAAHRWQLLCAWIAVFTIVVLLNVRAGNDAHKALCVFRGDLEARMLNSEKILREQQGQDPVILYGLRIPRETLTANAVAQRRSVEALDSLDCG